MRKGYLMARAVDGLTARAGDELMVTTRGGVLLLLLRLV